MGMATRIDRRCERVKVKQGRKDKKGKRRRERRHLRVEEEMGKTRSCTALLSVCPTARKENEVVIQDEG